jgi:hypothetical protein
MNHKKYFENKEIKEDLNSFLSENSDKENMAFEGIGA